MAKLGRPRKSKYPPPKTDPEFKKLWELFIKDIEFRDNFQVGHLKYLEVLCDLYVEYKLLTDILLKQGLTFETEGRNGFQIKPRPEVSQKNSVVGQITAITKVLNLAPVKNILGSKNSDPTSDWS